MNTSSTESTRTNIPEPSHSNFLRSLWRAEFLSPKDLVRRAAMLALFFLLASIFGLRDYTSIINGTMGSVSLGWHLSAFLGLLYVFIYLAFVLVAPILLLAAGMMVVWSRMRTDSRR